MERVAVGVAMPSMRLPTLFSLSKNGFFIKNPNPFLIHSFPLLKSSSSNHLRPSKQLPFLAMASAPSSSSSQTAAPGDVNSGTDFYQVIRAHQAAAARLPPIEEVRTALDQSVRGMLSTFSQKHEGYPSGSMVDFACDHDGSPIIAVSSLAVHSKDLSANPKCSLLVAKDPEDRTDLVIVVHGDAVSGICNIYAFSNFSVQNMWYDAFTFNDHECLHHWDEENVAILSIAQVSENDREAIRAAYLKRHPDAFWVDFGDFQFMHIEPKVVRYVSGVATALLDSGEFEHEEFKAAKVDPIAQFSVPVASHMNRDHADDTKTIVQHSTSVKVDFAHMLDLDSLGFNVKVGYQGSSLKLRIPFPRRAEDRKDVKTLIVEMLQAAKASSS